LFTPQTPVDGLPIPICLFWLSCYGKAQREGWPELKLKKFFSD
jgi:hypothetical protein